MNTPITTWVTKYNATAEAKVQIKNIELFADKVQIFCHYLQNSQSPHTYIPVHHTDLKSMLGKNRGNNYQRVILCAAALGLVKVDMRYQRGHHTRRYQLQSNWQDKLEGNLRMQTLIRGAEMLLKMARAYQFNETVATCKIGFATLQLLFGANFYASLVLLQVSGLIRFSSGKSWCKIKLLKKSVRKPVQKKAEKCRESYRGELYIIR